MSRTIFSLIDWSSSTSRFGAFPTC